MNYIIPGFVKAEESYNNINIKNMYSGSEVEIEIEYGNEFYDIFRNGTNKLDSDLKKFLYNNELLFDENKIQKLLLYYYSANEEELKIIILPTEKCNFRCVYCYEDHKEGYLSINYEIIISFIKSQIVSENSYKSLNIMWFGGEPLLRYEEIIKFNERVKKLCFEEGIFFFSSITTNGYLLNTMKFNKLLESGIRTYQITLDGDQHDLLRSLINGFPTKKIILENLKSIRLLDFDFTIIIRVNVSKTSGNNYSFYSELNSIIGNDKRFLIDINNIFETEENTENYKEFCDDNTIVLENIKMVKKIGLNLLESESSNISTCYATSKSCYTFRPNGSIVKCTVCLNSEWNKIGNILIDDCFIDNRKNTFLSRKLLKEECKFCANLLKCKSQKCLKAQFSGVCNYEKNTVKKL